MSWLTSIFSSSDAVDKGLDIIKRGADAADALVFTDEEKANLKKQWGDTALEFVKATVGENTLKSISRRYLAWGIISLAIFLTLYGLVFYTIGALASSTACADVATYSKELLITWWPIVLAIGVFYFGPTLLSFLRGGNK